jgi:hypothetical protein
MHQLCQKAPVLIVRTMERTVAATYFRRLLDVLFRQGFRSLKASEIGLRLDDDEIDDSGFLAAGAGMADVSDLGVWGTVGPWSSPR